jgi:signal transduction histidine kinase
MGFNLILVIISALIAFFLSAGILFFLIKKNIISLKKDNSSKKEEKPSEEDTSEEKPLKKIEKIKVEEKVDLNKENKALKKKVKNLNETIKALEIKITNLSQSNDELKIEKGKLEEAKKKLETLQKQKDELLEVVAHDIKNPAGAIKNLVDLLESYDLNATDQAEIMETLVRTASRIVDLATEVAKVIEADKGLFELDIKEIKINEIAENVFERYRSAAEAKDISMKIELDENIPSAKMDPGKIDEVIDNFITNAIKFCPSKSTILMRTYMENDNLIVSVSDDGYGMGPEEVQKVFKKGIKLSTRPTGNESSTGIGLWIAKKIIDVHQGKIWVKSKKNAGSTFAFSLSTKEKEIQKEKGQKDKKNPGETGAK